MSAIPLGATISSHTLEEQTEYLERGPSSVGVHAAQSPSKGSGGICPPEAGDLRQIILQLEMWANAQRDGRPAERRWRPLFNAAMFG